MKKYRVVEDLQGGDFGKHIILTTEEWRERALEWASQDKNDDLYDWVYCLKEDKVIETIGNIWGLEFKELTEEELFWVDKAEESFYKLKEIVNNFDGSLEELCKQLKGHNLEDNSFDLNYDNIVVTIFKEFGTNKLHLSSWVEIWDNNDMIDTFLL